MQRWIAVWCVAFWACSSGDGQGAGIDGSIVAEDAQVNRRDGGVGERDGRAARDDGGNAPEAGSADASQHPASAFRAISLGAGHGTTSAIDAQGRLYLWGTVAGDRATLQGDDSARGHFTDWVASEPELNNYCGLRESGEIWCRYPTLGGVANNVFYQHIAMPAPVRSMDVSAFAICAIVEDKRLFCFGRNVNGTLGLGDPATLETCGELSCSTTSRQVGTANDWDQISISDGVACGRRGGKIDCWGATQTFGGDLATGTPCSADSPSSRCHFAPTAAFTEFSDWAEVVSGFQHVCARRTNGDVHCKGSNASGALGVQQPAFMGATQIDVGRTHACALREGAVFCWGNNVSGQLGVGELEPAGGCGAGSSACSAAPLRVALPENHVFVQVVTGSEHSCARDSEGQVYCWGLSTRVGVPRTSVQDNCYGDDCALTPLVIDDPAVCGSPDAQFVQACESD